jgi:DNA-binding MarR family transcriptional regulator
MDRDATVEAVVRALRRVNIQGSLFGQTVAIRLGLSESDIEALELLIDTGAATAGRLAQVMGLTTGAVTRVIDRLEQAGYVRRIADPADRRRVIVEVVPDRLADVRPLLDRVGAASATEIARYTDAQLELIGDFLSRMAELTNEEAAKVREPATTGGPGTHGQHAAPLGGLSHARLLFRSGTSELAIDGGDLVDLYRARFEGSVPQVRLRDGTVSVQYRGLFDWRKRKASLTINTAIPWDVEVHGGTSQLTADLRRADLRSFSLTGGARRIRLSLGRPSGSVTIRFVGGTSELRIDRPTGVPTRLSVIGGLSRLEFDGRKDGARGGLVSVESPGAGDATDRFVIEIVGGASRTTIAERAD